MYRPPSFVHPHGMGSVLPTCVQGVCSLEIKFDSWDQRRVNKTTRRRLWFTRFQMMFTIKKYGSIDSTSAKTHHIPTCKYYYEIHFIHATTLSNDSHMYGFNSAPAHHMTFRYELTVSSRAAPQSDLLLDTEWPTLRTTHAKNRFILTRELLVKWRDSGHRGVILSGRVMQVEFIPGVGRALSYSCMKLPLL